MALRAQGVGCWVWGLVGALGFLTCVSCQSSRFSDVRLALYQEGDCTGMHQSKWQRG